MSFARLVLWLAAALGAAVPAAALAAEAYPSKPIHLLVNGAAGSLPDLFARPLADKLRALLGQAVVVDNRPGAGGILAMRELQHQPADGYTLALVTNAHVVWNPYLFSKLSYDPLVDLAPVSPIATLSMALVVGKDVPADSLPDFVALARQQPGSLNYASSSVGSPPHILFELLRRQASLDVLHVPYRSGPDAMNAVLNGSTQAYLVGTALAEPLLRDGRVRALAASPRIDSSPVLAALPTFQSLGYDGFEDAVWLGVVARKGVPDTIVHRLNDAIGTALRDPDTVQRYAASGSVVYHSSPAAFAQRIQRDHDTWRPLLKRLQIQLD